MKTIKILLMVFVCSASMLAQKTTTKPKATTTTTETSTTKPADSNISEQIQTTVSKLSEEDTKLLVNILTAETQLKLCYYKTEDENCKLGQPQKELAGLYQEAVKRPRVVEALVAEAVGDYIRMRQSSSISAPQIAQIALEQNAALQPLIIAQNQRIIELLEQIAKKK